MLVCVEELYCAAGPEHTGGVERRRLPRMLLCQLLQGTLRSNKHPTKYVVDACGMRAAGSRSQSPDQALRHGPHLSYRQRSYVAISLVYSFFLLLYVTCQLLCRAAWGVGRGGGGADVP